MLAYARGDFNCRTDGKDYVKHLSMTVQKYSWDCEQVYTLTAFFKRKLKI